MTSNRQAHAAARSRPHGTWARLKFDRPADDRLRLVAPLVADLRPLVREPVGEALVVLAPVPSQRPPAPVLLAVFRGLGARSLSRPSRASADGSGSGGSASLLKASGSGVEEGQGKTVRRVGAHLGEQPDRGEHVVVVHHDRGALGQLPAALEVGAGAAGRGPARRRPAGRAAAPRPTRPAGRTSRRSLPLRSTTRPSGLTTTRRPARVPPQRQAGRGPGEPLVARRASCVGRRAGTPGRRGASRGRLGAGRRARPPRPSATARQRIPRSPSTVRVTGVARPPRAPAPASSGSSSTTECTSVVAPPTSTTTTSPSAASGPASTSTPVSTTSGVAPGPSRAKSARALRCLPPITWAQEHLPDRGPGAVRREHPDPRHHVVGEHVRRPPAAGSRATSSRASTLPATTTGPRPADRASAAGGRRAATLGVAAVGAADQQHDVRPVVRQRRQRRRRRAPPATTAPPGRRWTAPPGGRPRR